MLVLKSFKVYEYPLKDIDNNTYYGSYTIKSEVKPLGLKGEKLVDSFQALVKE